MLDSCLTILPRLTTTEDLGLLIYNYCLRKNAEHELRSGLALAQKVFADAGSERLAMLCMVRQGRIAQALEYAKAKGAQMEDYTLVRTPQRVDIFHGYKNNLHRLNPRC